MWSYYQFYFFANISVSWLVGSLFNNNYSVAKLHCMAVLSLTIHFTALQSHLCFVETSTLTNTFSRLLVCIRTVNIILSYLREESNANTYQVVYLYLRYLIYYNLKSNKFLQIKGKWVILTRQNAKQLGGKGYSFSKRNFTTL